MEIQREFAKINTVRVFVIRAPSEWANPAGIVYN